MGQCQTACSNRRAVLSSPVGHGLCGARRVPAAVVGALPGGGSEPGRGAVSSHRSTWFWAAPAHRGASCPDTRAFHAVGLAVKLQPLLLAASGSAFLALFLTIVMGLVIHSPRNCLNTFCAYYACLYFLVFFRFLPFSVCLSSPSGSACLCVLLCAIVFRT